MSDQILTTVVFLFSAMILFSFSVSAEHEVSIEESVECGQKVEWGKNCGIAVKCSGDAMGAAQLIYPDTVAGWGSAGIAWAFDDDPDGIQWIPESGDPGCKFWAEGDPYPTRTGPDVEDQVPAQGEPGYEGGWEFCTYLPVNDNAKTMCLNSDTLIYLPANPTFGARCEGPGKGNSQSVVRVDVDFSGCGFEWRPNVHDDGCLNTGWTPGEFFPPRTGPTFLDQIPAPGEDGYVDGWLPCSYVYFSEPEL
jgi:hypothetical protein